ncbi:MAG: agmatine deiminase family protein [Bacteroidetes bacterium]|nr:agmatine deiminase family protein [Bacteroidota bacterium]
MSPNERALMPAYLQSRSTSSSAIATPPASQVRTIGEWEELQGFLITWTNYQSMLKEIVRYAKEETRVYIVCSNATTVINYLAANNIDTVNVTCMQVPYNSVWSRDYGPWSAYTNDVDSLLTIEWIYNRPRPLDDAIPGLIATQLNTPFYETTTAPWNLIHTGGNFMTDGFGTGFSSNLVIDENPSKTEPEIDSIMNRFMGINRYIKMSPLPYDVIHHIDMHLKLLDEETLLFGEYPTGVADGPQIEANMLYVLNNFNSVFGTPYKIVRIPMPPDNGQYPNTNGDYFTYTNSSFINKTIIVPTYNIPQDTTALRIYRDALPGYKVIGINSTASIGALGALHCITKELGTSDPLLISHQPLPDTYDDVNPYFVAALMKHRSGILNGILFYRTDTLLPYQSIPMYQGFNPTDWLADIPAQPVGTTIYYYVQGQSVSGKQQVRPMPAPDGYWKFKVLGTTGLSYNATQIELNPVFPNPSKGITCIPLYSAQKQIVKIVLKDVFGRDVAKILKEKHLLGTAVTLLILKKFLQVFTLLSWLQPLIFRQKLVVR